MLVKQIETQSAARRLQVGPFYMTIKVALWYSKKDNQCKGLGCMMNCM